LAVTVANWEVHAMSSEGSLLVSFVKRLRNSEAMIPSKESSPWKRWAFLQISRMSRAHVETDSYWLRRSFSRIVWRSIGNLITLRYLFKLGVPEFTGSRKARPHGNELSFSMIVRHQRCF
jgi:hypothetical protein